MGNWRGAEEFLAVVEKGSFTAAADALGLSKSYVSKTIAELEHDLGVQLLFRTTRRLSLTAAGELFYDKCCQMRAIYVEAERAIGELHDRPVGRVRVALSGTFGTSFMAASVARFAAKHPEVQIEIEAYMREADIAPEAFDVVIRYGDLPDSELKSRRIGFLSHCLCAAPAYIDKYGWPQNVADLAAHQCLTDSSGQFSFNGPSHAAPVNRVRVRGRWVSNSGVALAAAAKHALGIAQLPTSIIREDLLRGHLVTLEEDWSFYDKPVWAVFSAGLMPVSIRAFLDHLCAMFGSTKLRPDDSEVISALAGRLKV